MLGAQRPRRACRGRPGRRAGCARGSRRRAVTASSTRAVFLGELVDQVGGGGHALHAGEPARRSARRPRSSARAGRRCRSCAAPGTSPPAPAARRSARRPSAPSANLTTPSTSLSRVISAMRSIARVDVHQVAVGVADDDRPGRARAVEVLHGHALAAEVDRVEAPGDQRLGVRLAFGGHPRVDLGQPRDHRVHRAQAAPDLARRVAAIEPAEIGAVPHAAFLQVAVAFDQPGHQHLVGEALVERRSCPRPACPRGCRRPARGRRAPRRAWPAAASGSS